MSRESTKRALFKFYERQIPKDKPKRRNMAPERDQTEKPCFQWFKDHGFLMTKVESKAVFSKGAGRYLRGQAEPGLSDALGCCPDGTAAFVEFKAPGQRATLKSHQRDFLLARIEAGAFAVCVDSVKSLDEQWMAFEAMRLVGRHRDYLKSALPKLRPSRAKSDPPDELF